MKSIPSPFEALRSEKSFNSEHLADYLKMTQDALKASVSEYQKRGSTLLLLIIVCELLLQSLVAELSFAGLKVSDMSLIQKALPLGIAYAFYSLISIIAYRRLLEEVHDTVFKLSMPELGRHNFAWFAHPPTPFHLDKIIEATFEGFWGKPFGLLRLPFLIAILFGSPTYVLYVVLKYFSVYGLNDVYLWITAIGSIIFLMQGFMTVFAVNKLTNKSL